MLNLIILEGLFVFYDKNFKLMPKVFGVIFLESHYGFISAKLITLSANKLYIQHENCIGQTSSVKKWFNIYFRIVEIGWFQTYFEASLR